ncbi:hypothetical protein PTKIN_Ptkin05aG0198100 [Pterospermum kingtungense]
MLQLQENNGGRDLLHKVVVSSRSRVVRSSFLSLRSSVSRPLSQSSSSAANVSPVLT